MSSGFSWSFYHLDIMSDSATDPRPGQSVARALSVLDLFDGEHAIWSAEGICAALRCPLPTGYRYLRELVAAGLVRRVAGGFALGARIILLDYVMRQGDELLKAAMPPMRALAQHTGCDCVLSALYGEQIIDVHRETGAAPLMLAYGRGRPRPLFAGAAAKVILAAQPAAWVRKLYDSHAAEAADANMGHDWKSFRSTLSVIRKQGYYTSRGELEKTISAVAAPIAPAGQDAAAAIAIVADAQRFEIFNEKLIVEILRQAARQISLPAGG
jgi:DNA-binding IclR family transcriptional regulator